MAIKPTQDATSKVITIVDRATKTLDKTRTDLSTVLSGVQTSIDQAITQLVDTAEKVELKQNELDTLTQKYDLKLDESEYDLRIKVRDNKKSTLNLLLNEFDLANISTSELASIKTELVKAQRDVSIEINEAVEQAKSVVSRHYDEKISQTSADHRVELAELEATIKSLSSEKSFLQEQVVDLKGQVTAEREARISIAQAESNKQGVVVNTSK